MSNSVAATFLSQLQARLNRRSVAFFACLALASLFWLLSSLSQEYTDQVEIPVSYLNLPEDRLVVNEMVPVVTAQAKGFGFNLLWHQLSFDEVRLSINADPGVLPSITRNGERVHYYLTDAKGREQFQGREDEFAILSINPDTLFLKYKPKYTKWVPVKLMADIGFSNQFGMLSEPSIEPDSVLLTGLKETLDTITFIPTKHMEWNDLDESLTTEVALEAMEENPLVQLNTNQVTVELNVEEFTEGTVSIPLNIISQNPSSVKVFPSVVNVKYQVPLSKYDAISSDQFQASVVLQKSNANQSRLTVNVDRAPDFVKGVRVDPPQVEFIIQK